MYGISILIGSLVLSILMGLYFKQTSIIVPFTIITFLVLFGFGLVWEKYLGGTAEERLKRKREKAQSLAITAKEDAIAALKNPKGGYLGNYRGIIVYEMFIETPHGVGPITGAHATVDTASNMITTSRASLTRMAAGGILLGPLGAILSLGFKKHKVVDKRELYLLVETPQFASVIECPPDHGRKAREFAAFINTTAKNSAAIAEERPKRIQEAKDELYQALYQQPKRLQPP